MSTIQVAPIPIYQKQGRVWLQRTEGQPYVLLENHGINGINWPAPSPTQIRAQSTRVRAGNDTIDLTLGDSDLAAFTVPTRLAGTRNYLMAIANEFVNVQVHTGPVGNPTQYDASNYGLAWVLARRGTATTGDAALQDNAGDGVPVTFDVPFNAVYGPIPFDLTVALALKTTVEVQDALCVAVLPEIKDDAPARRALRGEVVAMGHVAAGAATANAYYSTDGLRTAPTVMTVDPFVADVDIGAVTMYGDKLAPRIIMAAETQAAQPAQTRYTDDYGATWSALINLGSTNTDAVNAFSLVDASHIYGAGGMAASAAIWLSRDGGATWTETDPGGAQPINDIDVMGNGFGVAVGDVNTVYVCDDFDNWSQVTGPSGGGDLLCCAIKPSTGAFYVGDDAGLLWYSQDEGASWIVATATMQGVTATAVNHIGFDVVGEFGFVEVTQAAARTVLRTIDGGVSWRIGNLGNAGLANVAKNDMVVFGPNNVLLVGVDTGGSVASIVLGDTNFDGGRLE